METIFVAFALGAGAVIVAKGGRRVLRRAVGWTAATAGWISGHAALAMEDAARAAREEFRRGRDGRAEVVSDTTSSDAASPAAGGLGSSRYANGANGANGAAESSWR